MPGCLWTQTFGSSASVCSTHSFKKHAGWKKIILTEKTHLMNCWEVCKYDVLSLVLQVKVSLDSLMDGLTGLSDIGDCVARVEHLLKELKALEEKARVG